MVIRHPGSNRIAPWGNRTAQVYNMYRTATGEPGVHKQNLAAPRMMIITNLTIKVPKTVKQDWPKENVFPRS